MTLISSNRKILPNFNPPPPKKKMTRASLTKFSQVLPPPLPQKLIFFIWEAPIEENTASELFTLKYYNIKNTKRTSNAA